MKKSLVIHPQDVSTVFLEIIYKNKNFTVVNDYDQAVLIWDGKSKGTKHMIDIAKKQGLTVIVVGYVLRMY